MNDQMSGVMLIDDDEVDVMSVRRVLDTARADDPFVTQEFETQVEYPLAGRSLVVLTRTA
jgi:hypothetical protein